MMLDKIAEITGLTNNGNSVHMHYHLSKIASKLTALPADVNDEKFVEAVEKAAEEVSVEQRSIFAALVSRMGPIEEREHEYKIKRSPKGVRTEAPAVNGVRYSFGPIWNASVIKGKGIAVSESNRIKLNHQAHLLGINGAEELGVKELAAKIAAKLFDVKPT